MSLFRRKKQNDMGLLAMAEDTANMAKNIMVLDKTEAALEKEVEKEEKRPPPSTTVGKVRRKGEHVIHGRYVLLLVVILNVLDCFLVLGELLLDIEYVVDVLKNEEYRSEQFIGSMKCRYPARLAGLGSEAKYIDELIIEIFKAKLTWDQRDTGNDAARVPANNSTRIRRSFDGLVNKSVENSTGCGDGSYLDDYSDLHVIEGKIAYGIHKASITILGILFLENAFKIFCLGKAMKEHKLECFDSFIVTASFILDIVFVKGMQQFTLHELVLFMAFIVPWRIIRVVNSLVVAIQYHQHYHLVLLYKHKKKVTQELKDAKNEINGLKAYIDDLKKLCEDNGITYNSIDAKLNMYRKVKTKTNFIGALTSFALGGALMKRRFTLMENGDLHSVFTIDRTIQAEMEEAVIGSNMLQESKTLVKPASFSNKLMDSAGHKSHPAIETLSSEHGTRALLGKLVKNSASFIATINNVRENNEVILKSTGTATEDLSKGFHLPDDTTSDSHEAEKVEAVIGSNMLHESKTPVKPARFARKLMDSARPKSHPAIETLSSEHGTRALIGKLVKNSASFIATINSVRENNEVILKSTGTATEDLSLLSKSSSVHRENNEVLLKSTGTATEDLSLLSKPSSVHRENKEFILKSTGTATDDLSKGFHLSDDTTSDFYEAQNGKVKFVKDDNDDCVDDEEGNDDNRAIHF